jgi:L-histidine N-alpha-methyltransferase
MKQAQIRAVEAGPRLSIQEIVQGRAGASLADDVRVGLTAKQKFLPPKYFYDERGSWLYDRICDTPEYYPARTEAALLADVAHDIVEHVRPDSILELGSGTSRKTEVLLDACEALRQFPHYQPLDVCKEMLLHAGERLQQRYRWLEIEALVGDYSCGLERLPAADGRRLYMFLGGTLGNFIEEEAASFLSEIRDVLCEDDMLLVGADRVKDPDVLHAAYNDAAGYTDAFNRNVLRVINRELDGDLDPERFGHRAFFNAEQSQIEMHLDARAAHNARIGALGMEVGFEAGESIHTEISRKFTPESITGLLARSGFAVEAHFEPENGYFSLLLARPIPSK